VLSHITPVILTLNEAANIGRSLERLAWARQVVIVDSGSTDETLAIAGSFANVRIVPRPFDSHAEQWRFAVDETAIQSDWILRLDADYMVEPALRDELASLAPDAATAAYQGWRLTPGMKVYNNVFDSNGQGGLELAGADTGAGTVFADPTLFDQVINNTFYNNPISIDLGHDGALGRATASRVSPAIYNNIIAASPGGISNAGLDAFVNQEGQAPVIGFNLFQNSGGLTGSNSVVAPGTFPLFVDPAKGDLRLRRLDQQGTLSPAIDRSLSDAKDRQELERNARNKRFCASS